MTVIFNRRATKSLRSKLRQARQLPERLLWYQLQNKKLGYRFRRQYGVGRYVVDFYCPKIKLVIEVDGAFHQELSFFIADQKRQLYLQSLGLTVARYEAIQILKELNWVVDDILRRCKQLDPTPTSAFSHRRESYLTPAPLKRGGITPPLTPPLFKGRD